MWMRKILNLANGTCFSWGQVGHILNSGHKQSLLGRISKIRKLYSKVFPIFSPKKKLAKFHMFQPLDLPTPTINSQSFHAIQPCCLCGTLQSTSCRHLLVVANLRHWIKERKLITIIHVAVAIWLNVGVQVRDRRLRQILITNLSWQTANDNLRANTRYCWS